MATTTMTIVMATICVEIARRGREAGAASAVDKGTTYSPSIVFHSLVKDSCAAM